MTNEKTKVPKTLRRLLDDQEMSRSNTSPVTSHTYQDLKDAYEESVSEI